MSRLSDMLTYLRKRQGLSQQELADTLRISRSAVSMYETDKREPDLETLELFADFYNVDMNTLTGNAMPPRSGDANTVVLHYAGPVAAHFNATPEDAYEYMQVPADWIGHRDADDFFLASVSGDSMYPHFQDGDLLLVLRCSDMGASGRIGIMVYGDGEATVKRIEYRQGEDWVDLVPVNPEYKTRRISGADLERCRVVGRVIKVIRTVEELV